MKDVVIDNQKVILPTPATDEEKNDLLLQDEQLDKTKIWESKYE